jgi:hypothetical protein
MAAMELLLRLELNSHLTDRGLNPKYSRQGPTLHYTINHPLSKQKETHPALPAAQGQRLTGAGL